MNRRPSKSRSSYDAFAPQHTGHFKASSPDVAFFESRKRRSPLKVLLWGLLLALIVALAGNFLANHFAFVSRIEVPVTRLPETFDGYTLLHISDLKGVSFGGDQGRLSMALSDAEFDAVLLTGDMVSPMGNAQPLYALIDALRALRPGVPVYFIAGDEDPVPASLAYAGSGSPFAPWVLGAQQRGAILLSAPQRIERESESIWLCTTAQLILDLDTMQQQYEQSYLRALEADDHSELELELAEYNLTWLEGTRSARSEMKAEDTFIALTHVPPTQEDLSSMSDSLVGQVDLLLSGHYLGGLMRLPLIGPLFVPSQELPLYGLFPGPDAVSGLTRVGRTWVYTSPGLGSASALYPPFFFRLFNPPTVTLLTLTPSAL